MSRVDKVVIDPRNSMEAVMANVRVIYDAQLAPLGLTAPQIQGQTLEQLHDSLERVNRFIDDPSGLGSFSIKISSEAGAVIVLNKSESHFQVNAVPLLLERKKLILDRIRELTPQAQAEDFKEVIVEKVVDPGARAELLKVLDKHEAAASDIARESEQVEVAQEAVVAELRQTRIQVEQMERKAKVYLSFLEREPIAALIGALLLIALTITLIVAMFTEQTPSELLSNSFLIILGYFFGQSTARRGAEVP